jgi:hypothetical protein
MLVVLTTQEAELGGWRSEAIWKKRETLSDKQAKAKRAGGRGSSGRALHCEALNSSPSTVKKKKFVDPIENKSL